MRRGGESAQRPGLEGCRNRFEIMRLRKLRCYHSRPLDLPTREAAEVASSATLSGSHHKAPGFAGGYLPVVSKSAASRTGQPLGLPAYSMAGLAGVSFKHEHLAAFLAEARQDVFFEIHAEKLYGCRGVQGGRPITLARFVVTTRSRCTERACRLGVRNLSTVTIWDASKLSSNAMHA
jgi:hypothetical protein